MDNNGTTTTVGTEAASTAASVTSATTDAAAAAAGTASAAAEAAAATAATTAADTGTTAAITGTTLTDPPAKAEVKADAPAAPVVPDKYELKLPETPTLDQAALDRTAAFARERGLSQEAAQAALDLANTEAKTAVDAAQDRFIADYSPGDPEKNIAPGREWTRMQGEWQAASLADPEIGNGKQEQFDAAVKKATQAFDTFASPAFRTMLRTTGYGSHPELLRVFAKIGAAMGEGTFAVAGTHAAPDAEREKLYQMYPSMRPKD